MRNKKIPIVEGTKKTYPKRIIMLFYFFIVVVRLRKDMTKIPIHANRHTSMRTIYSSSSSSNSRQHLTVHITSWSIGDIDWCGCMCCVCMGKWHSKHLQFCLTKQHFYWECERGSTSERERASENICMCVHVFVCVCVFEWANANVYVVWMTRFMLSKEYIYYHARTRSHSGTHIVWFFFISSSFVGGKNIISSIQKELIILLQCLSTCFLHSENNVFGDIHKRISSEWHQRSHRWDFTILVCPWHSQA